MDDRQLLRRYILAKSQVAFAAIVERYTDLVYSSARRQMRDGHAAQEVTQAVFILLARKASAVRQPGLLGAWLLRTTHFACREAKRREARRQFHEQQVASMRSEIPPLEEPAWETYAMVIDEAMARLREMDRSAVTLRYLQGLSLRDVGEAIGCSEEAARKRVDRGVAKLRAFISEKTAAPSAAGLALVLGTKGIEAAPPDLAGAVISLVSAGGVGAGSAMAIAKGVFKTMLYLKLKPILAAVLGGLMLTATGAVVAQQALAPAVVPAANPCRANAAGLTIEAVAVGRFEDAVIWKPDGTAAADAGLAIQKWARQMTDPAKKSRTIAFRHTGALEMPAVRFGGSASLCAIQRADDGWVSYCEWMSRASERNATIRMEIAAGPWRERLTRDQMTDATGGGAVISESFVTDDGVVVIVSDVQNDRDYRVIGLDKADREHYGERVSTVLGEGIVQIEVLFRGLQPADLKAVRYETRRFTDFVEFSDIAIDPGIVTSPRVRTGKISPGIIPADNPGQIGEYYAGGDVTRVGVYSLTARQITLKQAIISAGVNTNNTANMEVALVRRTPGNQERIILVEFDAVMKGEAPDYFLQPDDALTLRTRPAPATSKNP